jgi:hypothetical protein
MRAWRREVDCYDGGAEFKKNAGKLPALRYPALSNSFGLALVVRFGKNQIRIDDGPCQGFHWKLGILRSKKFFLRAAFCLHALLFLSFHLFLALLKR